MIHPPIETGTSLGVRMEFSPLHPEDTLVRLTGTFSVGGETFEQQGVLQITSRDAYLGFPLSFDPTKVLDAYNDAKDTVDRAAADVNHWQVEVERLRGVVRAEREQHQQTLAAAHNAVDLAKAEVNRLNAAIAGNYRDISHYRGRIKSW